MNRSFASRYAERNNITKARVRKLKDIINKPQENPTSSKKNLREDKLPGTIKKDLVKDI